MIGRYDRRTAPLTQKKGFDVGNEQDTDAQSGIQSRGGSPIEKVLGFLAAVPTVSKEVALKVAEQLPEVRKIATKALSGIEKAHERTVDANKWSQEHAHRAFQEIRDVLKGELKEEDLTWEQKREIYDLLMQTAEKDSAKDSENKRALDTWLKGAGVVAIAGLAVCVALLGARNPTDQT